MRACGSYKSSHKNSALLKSFGLYHCDNMKDRFWVEESSGNPSLPTKRKRRVGKRKVEFVGWGSRPLIEFLEVIGEDTVKKHSQYEVAAFVTKYINDKGLLSPEKKKKKVLCDEMLLDLFGKKFISRTKVYDLLEEHFAENHDDSDDDLLDSSDEENYKKKDSKSYPTGQKKKVPGIPKSSFAAVIPENIKLVYLKRTLVQELLKVPESFECKIVGSFVRMKSDPNDIYQRNRFQLQQVTGVEKVSGAGDAGIKIHLRVSNYFKDVPISMLSDDNFSEEEMEDLRDRIKAGLLKRPTVVELELKAQMLHADVTKHWIVKEVSLLQKLIDHANEKGRRRELFEFLERRKQLQKPSEQEKLLLAIPEVIAEEVEPDGILAGSSEKAEGSNYSPKSTLRGSSDVSSTDASGSGDLLTPSQVIFNDSSAFREKDGIAVGGAIPVEAPNACQPLEFIQLEQQISNAISSCSTIQPMESANPKEKASQEKQQKTVVSTQVIELSDDEPEPEDTKGMNKIDSESAGDEVWQYLDPQGQIQGPFSLYSLKRWSDANYFDSSFTVWKTGQSPNEAVLLADALGRIFPC